MSAKKRPWTVERETKYLIKFISSVGSTSRYDGAFIDFHDGSTGVINKAEGVRFLALPDDEKYRLVRALVLAMRDCKAGVTTTYARSKTELDRAQILAHMFRGMDSLPPVPTDFPLLDLTGKPAVLPPGRIA
ncbi:MAG: hypothetical protein M3436_01460 [Pseudomonadota bacterium]|nr:hypothetical protein [Pseudomonadota bacterium]